MENQKMENKIMRTVKRLCIVSAVLFAAPLLINCGGGGKSPGSTKKKTDTTTDTTITCTAPEVDCDGVCIDIQTDPAHCGACGTPVGTNESCVAGVSTNGSGGTSTGGTGTGGTGTVTCQNGETTCGTNCVDTQTDSAHCGTCDAAVPVVASCMGGIATCDDATLAVCGTSCVDFKTDVTNCGSCGNSCGDGSCTNGVCTCATTQSVCGTACATLATDPAHCGACGNAIPTGASCISGQGACPTNAPDICNGVCVDKQTDVANCGICGTVVAEGATCVAGASRCTDSNQIICGGVCVSTSTDQANCGGCTDLAAATPVDKCCPEGAVCGSGICAAPATAGLVLCVPPGAAGCGVYVDLSTSLEHCGACNTAAPAGGECINGAAQCLDTNAQICGVNCANTATDQLNCGGCTDLAANPVVDKCCPVGASCGSGICTAPAAALNLTLCTAIGDCGEYIDLQIDEANCGNCGTTCAVGATCTNGLCACPGNQIDCNGTCVDPTTDVNNCGACGQVVPAGGSCHSGVISCLDPNQVICGASCASTTTDINNCGACGNACDATFGTCVSGVCGCSGGLTWDAANGICADYQNDPLNCGVSGKNCGRSEYCSGGVCACKPGLTDCGGAGGILCVDLQNNDLHCGSCDPATPTVTNPSTACGGATPVCSAGACAATCLASETQCDVRNGSGNTNGCVDTASMQTDPVNCGGCRNRCQTEEACVAGNCVIFTVGRACNSCPCSDCGQNDLCCSVTGTNYTSCIQGTQVGDVCP